MTGLELMRHHLRPFRRRLAFCLAAIFVETGLELSIPLLMARLIDEALPAADTGLVLALGGQMAACALLALVMGFAYTRLSAQVSMGLGASLREAQYAHVQRLCAQDLDQLGSSLVTRMTSDVTVIQNAVMSGFRPLVRGFANLVVGLAMACSLDAGLARVFFAFMPLLALAMGAIVRTVAPRYRKLQQAMDQVNGVLREDLAAIRAIKAFVREEHVAERFDESNAHLARTATQTMQVAVLNMPAFTATMYVSSVCILWLGGNRIMEGTLTVGTLTGFMSYVLLVTYSLMMVSSVFLLAARAVTSVERVAEALGVEPSLAAPEHGVATVADGSVELDHVSFRYSADAETDVLADVCLTVRAGSTLGVLGATGSGKTTLAQLLPRLYDVTGGSVRVGGTDVRRIDLDALRGAVGLVPQESTLFAGTVRENLRWGRADATDEELLEACHVACADEFLDRIGGLDAPLGQGGAGVSGGQRQRLCLARALVARPQVLVLDDSTSAVDQATDALVRERLCALPGVTLVVIAQRVASVMGADKIAILDAGRVHAVGTHAELLASDPIYQELFASQMGSGDLGEGAWHGRP